MPPVSGILHFARSARGSPFTRLLSMIRREKSPEDLLLAQHILEEYRQAGAVRQVRDPENTKHLVPWFVISKEEQGGLKHRFITDCRELNRFLQPREFRLDHLQTILPYLRKGGWQQRWISRMHIFTCNWPQLSLSFSGCKWEKSSGSSSALALA